MERRPLKKEAIDEDLAADFEQPPRKKIHRDFGASSSRNEQVYGNENSLEEMQVSSYSTDNNQDVEMLSHHDDDLPDDPTEDMFADNVMRMDIPIQGNKNDLGKQIMSEFLSNTMLLRNSGGGVTIIRNLNYSEKDNDNLYKDSFTSKVDCTLQNMATYRGEVGEFNSWYQTVWWKGVGKWLLYYIKDGPQLTFPLESKVYTVNQHDHKEVGIEEIQRRLLQSTKKPSNYHPEVTHVHCKEKHGKLELGMKCFHLHESTNIQLKSSNASKEGGQGDNAINGMCKDIRHYSSAFSQNQEGGSIYFGITEKENPKSSNKTAFSKTPVVCGIKFDIDEEKERVIRMKIDYAMSKEMLWVRHDGEKANKDEIHQYYDVRFHNVGAENSTRKVLEVSVAKFYGCVFSSDPKPCYLDAEGQRKYYEVEKWVPIVMKDLSHSEDFISRFQRLDIGQKNKIYEVEKSSEKIQQSVFKSKL
ncbi:uncharacterized protein LOC132550782 [Ylistrum balloti]|uniref:uncharacterized protein LOC132550782 n=1 Tax=Ylistrum balloti TaxID=509963 RepID=UPI002905BC1F|nr:uncharacterized protein LOC132550782 [Ylistrum balloti]